MSQSETPSGDDSAERALVYSGQLLSMGRDARCAVALTRALERILPTDLATGGPVSPQVAEWAGDLRILPYEPGMERGYGLLCNVDPLSYAEPLARRNLAWVAAPHVNNVPAPGFEILGMSDHVVAAVERLWERVATRLYPGVDAPATVLTKERIILSVGRFTAPGPLLDHGHLQAVRQFRELCESGIEDWQLVLVGGLVPGNGPYLDRIQQAAAGLNVRIVPNADQATLDAYRALAAIYWDLEGLNQPGYPGAEGAFPLALIEAAATGAVPLAVGHGAAPEFVSHGYNGFLVESGAQCVELTAKMIRAPSAWSMLSQRALETSRGWTDPRAWQERVDAVLRHRPAPRPPRHRWLDHAPDQDQVCAVIAAYNRAQQTRDCLAALRELNPQVRIILVDNGSDEDQGAGGELAEASGGLLLRRERNDGLGAALAAAVPHCDRAFVAVLHNDVVPVASGDWLDVLLAEMTDPEVGVAGAKLKRPDGTTVQFAGWGFTPQGDGAFFHLGEGCADEPRFNQRRLGLGVSSACMLCRRELFDPDPGYRIVYNDLDLCFKAAAAGLRAVYQPASVLVHLEAVTRALLPDPGRLAAADRERFFHRHAEAIARLRNGGASATASPAP
ncbi:glycosyltransferase [Spiribacter halobius]|uniref:Glycosyl transferase n=1 Tax=Sediminicurvatus halobius TaxID=2182432 RepID=A0A2U2N2P7_9GAMM|nr:glycosyltransferase [Spiribacter halobius]PWG63259.1 hypothetical protein DEM34_09290 [Spiribacter halobius]UEX76669.1 glycosyltransferase [Spiribacter halobius]